MKKRFLSVLTLIAFLSVGKLSAQNVQDVFRLSPVTEPVLLGSGSLIYGTELLMEKVFDFNQKPYENQFMDLQKVNAFDRAMAHQYNRTLDKTSDVFLVGSFFLPLSLGAANPDQWLTCATMYAETMLLAQGIKETIKLFVNRPRPYMYFEGFPEKDVFEENDWANSFLSGHSTMSFAAATFTTYTFCKYFPDSPWRFVVAAGSYLLSTGVAVMRVFAGCHFVTDVVCGALLGTLIGFLVPFLHTLDSSSVNGRTPGATPRYADSSVMQLPLGFSFSTRL